jgi:hypothetical protein
MVKVAAIFVLASLAHLSCGQVNFGNEGSGDADGDKLNTRSAGGPASNVGGLIASQIGSVEKISLFYHFYFYRSFRFIGFSRRFFCSQKICLISSY